MAEPIRCRDCKHSTLDQYHDRRCTMDILADNVVGDYFYCALAERRPVNRKMVETDLITIEERSDDHGNKYCVVIYRDPDGSTAGNNKFFDFDEAYKSAIEWIIKYVKRG